ncbi:MAG TPA: hypothetical protein VIJ96_01670 [Acidothermaceae bacterium]
MSNATETKTAKVLEPQPSAGEATPPGHTEQPAEHTERKDSKKPRHAAEGTQATTAATAPLGTEWYADYTPVPLPRFCPAWCGREHWHSDDPDEQDPEWELHGQGIAAGYLPEVRRMGPLVLDPANDIMVTRAYQGTWQIILLQRRQRGPGIVPDPVVELELDLGYEHPTRTVVELLASEARELAAGLIAAADKMLLSR